MRFVIVGTDDNGNLVPVRVDDEGRISTVSTANAAQRLESFDAANLPNANNYPEGSVIAADDGMYRQEDGAWRRLGGGGALARYTGWEWEELPDEEKKSAARSGVVVLAAENDVVHLPRLDEGAVGRVIVIGFQAVLGGFGAEVRCASGASIYTADGPVESVPVEIRQLVEFCLVGGSGLGGEWYYTLPRETPYGKIYSVRQALGTADFAAFGESYSATWPFPMLPERARFAGALLEGMLVGGTAVQTAKIIDGTRELSSVTGLDVELDEAEDSGNVRFGRRIYAAELVIADPTDTTPLSALQGQLTAVVFFFRENETENIQMMAENES